MSNTTSANLDKVTKITKKVKKIINKEKLSIPELIVMYGNLGYYIGAAIGGITSDNGPNLEILQKTYYSNPTIDTYLMLQGLMITAMEEDFLKKPEISKLRKEFDGSKL